MKKILTLFFLLTVSAETLLAFYHIQVDGIWYDVYLEDQTAMVTHENHGEYSGDIVIPDSVTYDGIVCRVTSIGWGAFLECRDLTSVDIPETVLSIGDYAFSGCVGLSSIEIPNSVTSIGEYAFYGCNGLTSITIPESVTSIGTSAFLECSSLPVVDNIRYADTYLVEAIDKTLSSYTIKEGTRWIGFAAFYGCSEATSIEIPSSMIGIDKQAFYANFSLQQLTIPKNVTSLGEQAFGHCRSIETIMVEDGNEIYECPEGSNAIIHKESGTLYLGCKNTIVPQGVKHIGNNAFMGCSGLLDIDLPEGLLSIGDWSFFWCEGLTNIVIPEGVTSIGWGAFEGCTGLESVTIPNSVTQIEPSAFSVCPNIMTPIYNEHIFFKMPQLYSGSYEIPDGIEIIAGSSFWSCDQLTDITIPNSVTIIGHSAFGYCSGLTSIELPESLITIEDQSFLHCTGLISVIIPDSVTYIGINAFGECTSLEYIYIPGSVTEIGYEVFCGCDNLVDIVVDSTNTVYDSRNKCKAVVRTRSNSISAGCKKTTIPENIVSIETKAFKDCYYLEKIEIPQSVKEIGEEAFDECTGLTSIACHAVTPPTCCSQSFNSVNRSIPVYVPDESISAYQSAQQWCEFTQILPLSSMPQDLEMVNGGTRNTREIQKLIRQGNMYILTNDQTYTINGQLAQ